MIKRIPINKKTKRIRVFDFTAPIASLGSILVQDRAQNICPDLTGCTIGIIGIATSLEEQNRYFSNRCHGENVILEGLHETIATGPIVSVLN